MKTVAVAFPNIKGLFKCDDDIIPNFKKINQFIAFVENTKNVHYSGIIVTIKEDYYSEWHYDKCADKTHNVPKLVRACNYATGPLYYVSSKSINLLKKVTDLKDYFFEDVMVGHLLNKHKIDQHYYRPYYDNNKYLENTIQNLYKCNFLFIRLRGGLGNQLFMVSAAYELSKQNGMILILLYDKDGKNMSHNTANEFTTTIFSNFIYTCLENIDLSKLVIYNEERCFEYNPSIITIPEKDYILNGYFQNKKYITNEPEIVSIFKNDEICNKLLVDHPLLDKSYFIHIRRGDYVDNRTYQFKSDEYYQAAINYIVEKDKDAHFFVLSDDVEYIKNYVILQNINKTIIDGMNTIDSFYLMSMCKKGGVCANSAFSGWALKLNTNKDKISIYPEQWINIDYEYDIPF